MKTKIIIGFFLLEAIHLNGVPAYPYPIKINQPDRTTPPTGASLT